MEIQVSGRSDVISVDPIHLRKELLQGVIDLAVLVVPSDKLGYFLTDRVAKLSAAKHRIEMARAEDMPFVLIAMNHDGPGPALIKQPKRLKLRITSGPCVNCCLLCESMYGMNVDSDQLYEVEAYLESFGGFWKSIPTSLRASIRDLRSDEPQFDEHIQKAVEQTRPQCHDRAIRAFARICQKSHETPPTQI